MGLESRAVSARVTKQIVTIYSKTCNKSIYISFRLSNGTKPKILRHRTAILNVFNPLSDIFTHSGSILQQQKNHQKKWLAGFITPF